MDKGLVHLYFGDGKGKTTAAMGLALRALGQGQRVVIVQSLKTGTSGELEPLCRLGATVFSGKPGTKFVPQMSDTEKTETDQWNNQMLQTALSEDCDLLILDELCAALQYGLVSEELAKSAVLDRPADREVVITGRTPEDWMLEAADYVTEMRCCRHPFQRGITARRGIEY